MRLCAAAWSLRADCFRARSQFYGAGTLLTDPQDSVRFIDVLRPLSRIDFSLFLKDQDGALERERPQLVKAAVRTGVPVKLEADLLESECSSCFKRTRHVLLEDNPIRQIYNCMDCKAASCFWCAAAGASSLPALTGPGPRSANQCGAMARLVPMAKPTDKLLCVMCLGDIISWVRAPTALLATCALCSMAASRRSCRPSRHRPSRSRAARAPRMLRQARHRRLSALVRRAWPRLLRAPAPLLTSAAAQVARRSDGKRGPRRSACRRRPSWTRPSHRRPARLTTAVVRARPAQTAERL